MTLFYKSPSSSILQLLIITFLFHSNPVNAFAANRPPPTLLLIPPQSSYRAHHNYSPTTTTTSTSWNNSPTKKQRHSIRHSHTIHLSKLDNTNDDDDTAATDGATTTTTTKVGSSEYYQGFLTRSVDEEPVERVTGDAVLGPTLKFAGGISLILVVLTATFLVSNGIV
mmetsp:Transcript_37354/g.80615  ORF Transcript_37354/g.80615 Transcript_37354/m.80615 type:complete len:168 (+) Transcript_37354:68-571(+)